MHRHVSQNNPFHLGFVQNTTLRSPSWFYRLLYYIILKMIFFWNHKNVSDNFDCVIYRWPTMFHFTYRTDIFFILNHTSSRWQHQFFETKILPKTNCSTRNGFTLSCPLGTSHNVRKPVRDPIVPFAISLPSASFAKQSPKKKKRTVPPRPRFQDR